ncbi:hypothetical protein EYC84_010285 [Monilinia fructicola]|uniref:Uncharacterized protein n=1 Tax=Monilinia fructicola TaxID=38448 RepID=A0A5M9JHP1_MONFR|nr:hypothetical protein EYC84_010285 [Monilinia fructicola]
MGLMKSMRKKQCDGMGKYRPLLTAQLDLQSIHCSSCLLRTVYAPFIFGRRRVSADANIYLSGGIFARAGLTMYMRIWDSYLWVKWNQSAKGRNSCSWLICPLLSAFQLVFS